MTSSTADYVGLRWAVKQSFTSYLSRMPDGRMSIADGATLTVDQDVVWEPMPGRVDPTAGSDRALAFRGDLRYGGHGGLLFVRVADPVITWCGNAGELTVVDTFSEVDGARLPLVTFTIDAILQAPGFELMAANDVRLTEQGTHLFNDVYPTDEPFEPLSIVWPTVE